jgi:hypothetical protein
MLKELIKSNISITAGKTVENATENAKGFGSGMLW